MELSWIGKKVKCVYGLDCGNSYTIISEPFKSDFRTLSVLCRDNSSGEELQLSTKEILGSIYYELVDPDIVYTKVVTMVWDGDSRDKFSEYLKSELNWEEFYSSDTSSWYLSHIKGNELYWVEKGDALNNECNLRQIGSSNFFMEEISNEFREYITNFFKKHDKYNCILFNIVVPEDDCIKCLKRDGLY